MILKTLLATGLTILTMATMTLSAEAASTNISSSNAISIETLDKMESESLKTIFTEKEIVLYNDDQQADLICVTDGDDNLLFTAFPVAEHVYTTTFVNVRNLPNIKSKPEGLLAPNSKILRVGRGSAGWDVIQINKVNYFIWSEYLTLEKPSEVIDVYEIKPNQPGVYSSAPKKKSSTANKTTSTNNQKGSYLGNYKLTAYCNCSKCCGKWAGGNTASGTVPTVGRTVACNSLPFGTKLNINGHIYTVEDTGNMADNVIDIYFDSHSSALQFGVQYADVYKVN